MHALKDSHKANRKTNARKLYEDHLAGEKSEFIVTLDEALFNLQDCSGKRKNYFSKDKNESEEFMFEKKEKFARQNMVVGAISGSGVLSLIKVPQKVKVNAQFYTEHILKA